MSNGDVILEMIVDVPEDQVEATKQDFESEGFTVAAAQQESGLFAIAAAKCRH